MELWSFFNRLKNIHKIKEKQYLTFQIREEKTQKLSRQIGFKGPLKGFSILDWTLRRFLSA